MQNSDTPYYNAFGTLFWGAVCLFMFVSGVVGLSNGLVEQSVANLSVAGILGLVLFAKTKWITPKIFLGLGSTFLLILFGIGIFTSNDIVLGIAVCITLLGSILTFLIKEKRKFEQAHTDG